ncbi:hypothetical protein P154DRAFT_65822 [Amniculicola lignicola CBS 123094]|uniref:Uncharacterized protein n=1 Tax=Amniculicola lignicola CBS 123094 TaxID=1392246 RepID=A0A6A5WSX7_9PLEO|nr:hypothetical protein P154DRAFT_65822 [Amniculicola lignicola CBS 123094]
MQNSEIPVLISVGSLPGVVPSNSSQITLVSVMQELVMVAVSPMLELIPTKACSCSFRRIGKVCRSPRRRSRR